MQILNIIQIPNGRVGLTEQKVQVQIYYYQQEQVIHLVNKEYMIWPEMYLSGHLKITLILAILVSFVGAITTAVAAMVQRPTVAAAVRPITITTLVLGLHFSKS